jgi:hypothetical protein
MAPTAPAAAAVPYGPSTTTVRGWAAQGNKFSFITVGVVAVYILLAFSAHIVVFGILPVLMSVRAVRAKERLGWVAVGFAAVAVLVALVAFAH